ncbi:Glycosyl transferase family 2 [Novipirellula galeiformis]|uniref:Glycosyl transferase family 2 n=1 Tax=Novipirellula galeiformis TaxID=2528004 RepID=A0A5C6CX32_9BACT|nr:Glycosyl transferase family 2 [Novipirellula galeiformis]
MAPHSLTFKEYLGCWLHERWRTELILKFPGVASAFGWNWKDLHNRHEKITTTPETDGRICHWRDSSPLTVARFLPHVGGQILQHCLQQWPVAFDTRPNACSDRPEVSFVVGVRGTGRLPQFQATVASLLGQSDCETEVIIVEQSWQQEFAEHVPDGARYYHTPTTCREMPYNRSWALNFGARRAKGRVVVLHDGDYVVPTHFGREVAKRVNGKLQSSRLPRYIFYLDQAASERVQNQRSFQSVTQLEQVVQNNPTPMAVTRKAYMEIGGHDEAFYGWGGEDNEFLDRARQLEHSEGAFLPVFHLWHPEAPNRSGDRNAEHRDQIMAKPATSRIKQLAARPFGELAPSVIWQD